LQVPTRGANLTLASKESIPNVSSPPSTPAWRSSVVMVVEDNADIADVVQDLLELEGYSVVVARSGQEALDSVREARPDLLLLDLGLPDMDGLEVCRQLRADPRWGSLSIVAFTSRAGWRNQVIGLHEGFDGYVVKPFEVEELLARVDATLRQSYRERQVNPLTFLPGNNTIEIALLERLKSRDDFDTCYLDIDGFKAYNDRYGFAAGDDVILRLAALIRTTLDEVGSRGFHGHVGGDDFVVLLDPGEGERVCAGVLAGFGAITADVYTADDLARGAVEAADRSGALRMVPTMTLSIAIVPQRGGRFSHIGEISLAAAEVKMHIKQRGRGGCMTDRRRS
jgi:diguanylate cyclase (GGDEF)-like protein